MWEAHSETVRALDEIYVSALARVEVPAALWGKHRAGRLSAGAAERLVRVLQARLAGASWGDPEFASVIPTVALLDRAARLAGTHALRGFDAVQLASALEARAADPGCDSFAGFDETLNAAAAAHGFALVR